MASNNTVAGSEDMSKPKRLRSAVTGKTQTPEQAAVNPRESVTETVKPPSVEIEALVDALTELQDFHTLEGALMRAKPFENRAALLKALKKGYAKRVKAITV